MESINAEFSKIEAFLGELNPIKSDIQPAEQLGDQYRSQEQRPVKWHGLQTCSGGGIGYVMNTFRRHSSRGTGDEVPVVVHVKHCGGKDEDDHLSVSE